MEVVASAGSGEEAIALFRASAPDVTLMDLQLGGISGVDAIRAIRAIQPDARIIVLTMYRGDEDIFRALQAGASAYLLKDTISDALIRVIREANAGAVAMDAALTARLAERASRPTLTRREVQVLELIAQGRRNRDIALVLGVSEETVDVHVKNIRAKLQVTDRTAAVNVALNRGIIHLR
jgi:two-component system NarL family response regulator